MSSRVGVLSVDELSTLLENSAIFNVTELPSINIITGHNEVSGDFVAVSSVTGDCVVISN